MRIASFAAFLVLLSPAGAGATMLADWSLEEVLGRSDRVVIGKIGGQRTVRHEGRVMTETEVRVERTLLGEHEGRIVLSQLGGIEGDVITDVVGTARLVPGRRMLLITHRAKDGRRYLVGMALGAYEMDGERLRQVVDVSLVDKNGAILAAPGPREAFLDDVIRKIQKSRGGQPAKTRPVMAPRHKRTVR